MSDPDFLPAHLLLVDDDDQLRNSLSRKLAEHGIEVDTATDGVEALRAMNQKKYDLVILDLNMPEKDGFAVLRERGITQNAETPIFVLTTVPLEKEQKALELGAVLAFHKQDFSGVRDCANQIVEDFQEGKHLQ